MLTIDLNIKNLLAKFFWYVYPFTYEQVKGVPVEIDKLQDLV